MFECEIAVANYQKLKMKLQKHHGSRRRFRHFLHLSYTKIFHAGRNGIEKGGDEFIL
ncbi:hypothetical protein ABET52_00350 [Saccharococcus caldoxylosilyticus]